jgi:hypothetical protein
MLSAPAFKFSLRRYTQRARCLAAAAPPPRKKRRAAAADNPAAAAAAAAAAAGGAAVEGNGNGEVVRRHGAVLGAGAYTRSHFSST